MRFCMNCGYKIENDPKFCPECGANLNEESEKMKGLLEKAKGSEENGTSAPVNIFSGMGMQGIGMMGMTAGGRGFSYSTHGMMFNSGYTLSIAEVDGKLIALYRKTGVSEQNAKQFDVDDAFFEKVTEIIDRYNGDSWNGFNEHAKNVYDGDSFSFSFSDGKGRRISAGGYMAWPAGLGSAIAEIRAMYDEIHDRLWPDLYKQLNQYIQNEVAGKYGNSALDVTQGYYLETIPLVHGTEDGYYNWGENPQTDGVLGYGIFSGYEGKNPKDPGLRAVVLLAKKEKVDGTDRRNTNLIVQYYGLERGEEPKLHQEFRIKREMIIGNSGHLRLFHFGSPDRTTVGVFAESRFDSGERMAYFYFGAYRLNGEDMEKLGEVSADILREDGKMSEEVLGEFCGKARDAGMAFLAIAWENDWRAGGFPNVPSASSIFGCSWRSVRNTDMPDNPDGSLAGTAIPGWEVKVVRM